jgi:phosphate:Na+ symporter
LLIIKNKKGGDWRILFATSVVAWLGAWPVLAAPPLSDDINWWSMGMQLAGGLALFLFGMEQMTVALKVVAGDRMKTILGKLTTNRVAGLITGAGLTAVIQSSSVTTVMLIGFVTANLMSLSQAIGVILGADIGTTVTAQIVAFKVTKYALALVAAGFLLIFVGKRETIRHYGNLIMGLGLIFFGMAVMSAGMKPVRSYEPFIQLMQSVSNPVIGILIATAFTALIQSSSAAMGVVIVLASQGLITLEGGIALALGANIGTCATAGLAAIGKPREAIRVAVAHVTFKITGVLLIVWWIPHLADFCREISPGSVHFTGTAKLAADTPRQIANAHTVFNVGIALLFLPFATLFARFCEWVAPDKEMSLEEEKATCFVPRNLDDVLLLTPFLALDAVRSETGRLGERVIHMFDGILEAVLSGTGRDLQTIENMDSEVDSLHGHVVKFLGKISMGELADQEHKELIELVQAANLLEEIGDIIEINLVTLGHRRIDENVVVSDQTRSVITEFHQVVAKALEDTVRAVRDNNEDAAKQVVTIKKEIKGMANQTAQHGLVRLVADEPNRLSTYTREMEVLENFQRIYTLCRSLARASITKNSDADNSADEG